MRHAAPSAPDRPGLAPASWEPGQGWPRTQTVWAPVSGESPPVLEEEAKLRGCHQFHLLGPGLAGDLLCGGKKEVSVE